MREAIDQFRVFAAAYGLILPPNLVYGKLQRCDVNGGRRGKGDGAYLLHLGGVPAGGCQNWRDGDPWKPWRAELGRELTRAEEAALAKRLKTWRRERDAETADRQAAAASEAAEIWAAAVPVLENSYLVRKGVRPNGTRAHDGRLVVPMYDSSGTLQSLQFISDDGKKRFLTGGRTAGCYFMIGEPQGAICIVEGFATGASVYEATGHAVAVAFSSGSLVEVARAVRLKLPEVHVVVCADDDYKSDGNPGMTAATLAAKAVGGRVVVPVFGHDLPERGTDFNDMHRLAGIDAVRGVINASLLQPEPPTDADSVTRFGEGEFRVSDAGVFYVEAGADGEAGKSRWLASRIDVVAMTRDQHNNDWGRLLTWQDSDGRQHEWSMPVKLLQADGADVRSRLAAGGVALGTGARMRELLGAYLQLPVKARARGVNRVGWHGSAYVTHDGAIGAEDEKIVFQSSQGGAPAVGSAGTVEEWREHVGSLTEGNSRLVFALSVSFAGPLLEIAAEDSGGFHFRGSSSTGKTSALKLAASVWGPPAYVREWRATANALEGIALGHNDGVLILDELSQCDPKDAGEAAYMLANGQGKARANRSGAACAVARWRLLLLSSGEHSLAAHMATGNRKANAGQELRLADIDAEAGAGTGIVEDAHDRATPAQFIDELKANARRFHGTVGDEWLRHVVARREPMAKELETRIAAFLVAVDASASGGQVHRIARRFALVSAAGELATAQGLTGWQSGAAFEAAKRCFIAWRDNHPEHGTREEQAVLQQVRAFLEAHGSSRFHKLGANHDEARIVNRVGYRRPGPSGDYLVMTESFKAEICRGLDLKFALRTLGSKGWLIPEDKSHNTQKISVGGQAGRFYVLSGKIVGGE